MEGRGDTGTFLQGVREGFPIGVGYFPTAIAFGLVCRDIGLGAVEATAFSATNFAGSGQFLAANLIESHATVAAIFIGVLMINLRYLFMGASIANRLGAQSHGVGRLLVAFGTTDEVFSIATLRKGELTIPYMIGLESIAYVGWVGGTLVGFLMGMVLPPALQLAAGVTIYAMFASLLASESRHHWQAIIVAAVSAGINTLLGMTLHIPTGWAFVISMLCATVVGAMIMPDEPLQEIDDEAQP